MFVVDTNVLVYAADPDAMLHARCREGLESWRGQASPWYVTWPICYEFLRVTTHPKVFRKPWPAARSWQFLAAVLDAPSVAILSAGEHHAELLRETLHELPHLHGNILHDAHTAVLMREHGINRIVTRDTDFHRFSFLTVVDPVGN